MDAPVPRANYPWWVKTSLWGVPGRAGLWACVVVSILTAFTSIVLGFIDGRFFAGGVLVLAAVPYCLSIRWIDRHGSWHDDEQT
jgi:hypothetical protein